MASTSTENVADSEKSQLVSNVTVSEQVVLVTQEDSVNPELHVHSEADDKLAKVEEYVERKKRKIMNGMGSLLQQLRSTEDSVVEVTISASDIIQEKPKLNRKERRALLQQQQEKLVELDPEIAEQQDSEERSAKVSRLAVKVNYSLENPSLIYRDSTTFSRKVPPFGFGAICSNNYVKLAKFSPGGQFLASTSQDRVARIFEYDQESSKITRRANIPLGDLPYDAVWHPCGDLLATTARLHPIHFWNVNGARETSYRGINHLDELDAAQTVAFSNDGLQMFAGYTKCIRIWDVRRPGRHHVEVKTWRKQPYAEGQKARVSTISVHPFFDGVYAVGTYGPTIGLYSDRTNFVECLFSGDFQAVTDIKYSPDGMRLYSAGRKTNTIQCFDLRNPGTVLLTLNRPFATQQKVYFDIDSSESLLFSGTSDGEIAIFDLQGGDSNRSSLSVTKISNSSVPCVSLHPTLPILAACTGERIFPLPDLGRNDDEDDSDSEETERTYVNLKEEKDLENTVQLWRFDK